MKCQLAVWSSYYMDLSPEDAVLELKKHGIMATELSDEHGAVLLTRGAPCEVGSAFGQFVRDEGVTMTQGHLWLHCKLLSDPDSLEKLYPWLELYDAIGIKNAVLHVDKYKETSGLSMTERYDLNVEKLRKVESYIKAHGLGLRICLENLGGIARDIDGILYMLESLDSDVFGICLDTGHLNMKDRDQYRFITMAGDRLHALHIADNEGERDQHMIPFGRGNMDVGGLMRGLREVGYEGLFNYEIPGERNAPLPIRGYKLEYIRRCYEYLMEQEY